MRVILYCLLTIYHVNLYAQFGPEQVITTNMENSFMVISGDIDGDGDLDVFLSAGYDDKIVWFENIDGLGTFGAEQLIQSYNDLNSTGIVLADVDGDNDKDLIAVYLTGDKVSWFENTDGLGAFSSEILIADDLNGAVYVLAEDLDNDNDIDVVVSSGFGDKITWNENLDGQGTFSDNQIITTYVNYPREIGAADLDGDGDLDIFSVSVADHKLAWYENLDGAANFGSQQVITDDEGICGAVFAADIDGDNDLDLVAEFGGTANTIGWFENMDGQGNFSTINIVTNNIEAVITIKGIDVDLDNDIDIVAPSYFDNKVVWYENIDGNGNYSSEQIINTLTNPRYVYTGDFDQDGVEDLMIASEEKIIWHKNLSLLGVEESMIPELILYPNPTQDRLMINYSETINTVEIANQLGQTIATYKNQSSLPIFDLAPGIYFVTVENENGLQVTQKIVKE